MLEYGQPPWAKPLETNCSSPPSPQLVGARGPSLIYAGMLTGLMLCRYCASNQNCCKFMNAMVLYRLEDTLMPSPPQFYGSYYLSAPPPFCDVPWALCDTDVLFKTEQSIDNCSLHFDKVY